MKAKKRMAGLLAACISISAMMSGGASADSVTVTADRLNIRAQADAGSKSLGLARSGEEMSFVSESGSWYQVKYNGRTGFVMEDYVDLDLDELEEDVAANTEPFSAAGVTTDRVNIRKLPKTDASIVKVAPKKGKVEIIGQCGEWYQVKYGGKTGYLMAQYVTLTVEEPEATIAPEATAVPEPTIAPEPTAAPVQPEEQEPVEEIYDAPLAGKTNARVNMRAGASTKAKIVKVLGNGASVSILGECGEWYKVSAGGKEGYVIKECVEPVKEEDSSSADEIIYAEAVIGEATARVNMRKTPSTGAKIVKVVGLGQNVTIEGEISGWYKVTSGGREGYISKSYLVIRKDADGEAEVPDGFVSYPAARAGTVTVRVNMRKSASTSAGIEKVLGAGTQVTVTGEQGGFYQATYGGKSGYIAKAYVALGVPDGGTEETPDQDAPDSEIIYSEAKSGVTTVTVNMRAVPEGEVLHTLPAKTLVTLVGESGSWYKVKYGDSTGYISKSYVDQRENGVDTSGEGTKAYITAASVNMRRGPGTGYGVIKVLKYGAEIQYYALADGWYLIKAGEDTGYVLASYVSDTNPGGDSSDAGSGKVILSDWFKGEIQKVLERGDVGTITDVKTGLKFQFKRTGGYYHADAQPLTEDDTGIMFKIYGNKWKWDRRAIWVTVDGKTYAASMNGMPHGETDSMPDNDFDGCFCVHFLNSKTHEGNRVDSAHQTCVQEAYKAGK